MFVLHHFLFHLSTCSPNPVSTGDFSTMVSCLQGLPRGDRISAPKCRHRGVVSRFAPRARSATAMSSLSDFTAVDIDGKTRNLSEFVGKVSLVVNVASE